MHIDPITTWHRDAARHDHRLLSQLSSSDRSTGELVPHLLDATGHDRRPARLAQWWAARRQQHVARPAGAETSAKATTVTTANS